MSANPLDIRTAIKQIQEALTDTIDLAYRYRYPEAENLSALAEREAAKLPDRALVFVTDQGVTYRSRRARSRRLLHTSSRRMFCPPLEMGDGCGNRQALLSDPLTSVRCIAFALVTRAPCRSSRARTKKP